MSDLVQRSYLVADLQAALNRSKYGVANISTLVLALIGQDAWRERVEGGRTICFACFGDFVKAPPPEGLGMTLRQLRRRCGDDLRAVDAIDTATRGRHGGAYNPTGRNQYSVAPDAGSDEGVNVNNVHIDHTAKRPVGNSTARALRALREKRPDLHEQVLWGTLSPNRAMVEAGYRKRAITIPIDSPAAAARALVRHLTPEQVRELRTLLEAPACDS
jgi:hypothetical protein